MTENDIGRYCSSCSKSVTDFTQMTDQQILDAIINSERKVCGRLTETQLQKQFKIAGQKTNNSVLPRFLSGLLLFGVVDSTTANEFKTEIVDNFKGTQNKIGGIEQIKETPKDSLKNIIQGKVIDVDTKEPLSYVNILLKNSTTGTITDENGNFRLTVPDSLISDQVVIVIKYIGYIETEILINSTDLPVLEKILVIYPEPFLIGEVVIVKKKKWWQFSKRK